MPQRNKCTIKSTCCCFFAKDEPIRLIRSNMTTTADALQIILEQKRDFGTEDIPFDLALGRVLAEDLHCDRDMPPYNRVTMDGIAINYADWSNGTNVFAMGDTQAAGDQPAVAGKATCVEIMTGGVLPLYTDTIVPYEDIIIEDGTATIKIPALKQGQNIHYKGRDRKQGDLVVRAGTVVNAAVISAAATIGMHTLLVKKLPRVIVVSTGDELVEVDETPQPYQIRRSNNYSICALLRPFGIEADMLHLPDSAPVMEQELAECIDEYDVWVLSGGVSMGKFDHLPAVLEDLGVKKLFHKVQQRPGKPFWFGTFIDGPIVFAFPGNPVSTFMCCNCYLLPWLRAQLGTKEQATYAILGQDVTFLPPLTYFMQVQLHMNTEGQTIATPVQGNGSGDLANLTETDAFMELPAGRSNFTKGEVFKTWPFK